MIEAPTANAAETYKSLRIVRRETANGAPWLQVWRGKQSRPFANYSFSNAARLEEYVTQIKAGEDAREAEKAKRSADRLAVVNLFEVGDIIHHSWGYEQTQCDFY